MTDIVLCEATGILTSEYPPISTVKELSMYTVVRIVNIDSQHSHGKMDNFIGRIGCVVTYHKMFPGCEDPMVRVLFKPLESDTGRNHWWYSGRCLSVSDIDPEEAFELSTWTKHVIDLASKHYKPRERGGTGLYDPLNEYDMYPLPDK